jgi:hypothetical protein
MLTTSSPDTSAARKSALNRLLSLAAGTVAIAVLLAPAAQAQESAAAPQSRDELLTAAQAQKATQLRPHRPDALDRRLAMVDRALRIFEAPVYPFIGSAMEGGGMTMGPGFRGRIGATGGFDVHGGVSIKGYQTVDATLALPALMNRRLTMELRGNWVDAPEVALFDLGNGSNPESRTDFALEQTTVGLSVRFRAARFTRVGGGLDWLITESVPSSVSQLPEASPTYRRARFFAEVDTRNAAGYTRRGGLYRVEGADYHQTNGTGYNFRRIDAEARQFVPFLRENWVLAFRALASTTSTPAGNEVPYFLMPELGGSRWLRGYPSWRFRDNNRMLFSAEYRWTAGSFVDMALFLDAGRVAAKAGDLTSGGFKKTYGIGVSLHTLAATVTRLEYARTPEGSSVLVSFGPSF